jgi:hypothetical protein
VVAPKLVHWSKSTEKIHTEERYQNEIIDDISKRSNEFLLTLYVALSPSIRIGIIASELIEISAIVRLVLIAMLQFTVTFW